jgi:diamine N-acetyltransferase
MTITLRDITTDNFRACVQLKVAPDQEGMVAPNVYSIAQSKVQPELVPAAIYQENTLIGFALTGPEKPGEYWIVRFMIGEQFQGQGLGQAALAAVVDDLAKQPGCEEIRLSFVPGNVRAEHVYLKGGFEHTGIVEEGEIVMRYLIKETV